MKTTITKVLVSIFPALAGNVFLASTAAAQHLPLGPEDAKAYVSGKVLEYVRKNGQTVQMDFKTDGRIVTTNRAASRVSNGVWQVDEMGQVCQTYPDSNYCFLVYPAATILWIEGKSQVSVK